ncbi:MAG TPA: iron-sulfur cluster repair di-iron protein [Phycisphaerae bacterium]|nr:iron-sulfur cluster repair di-iron protein [Phycisphaerae bacterium]HOJ72402.1 iron-sulfur cluster repair di-iron protein [Phycisphaerae bacterium]HOM49936.1 iron-sulfur cluster repair di-iron protein [Phycisphaerae bacterium]HON66968.1 iron-sulfur cluster repair di-iron protein [Phycisphaerae bacterium]HOQ87414.1 iron-sulfur cluster repair di-iron protein [Phycisphaerae bacterium]
MQTTKTNALDLDSSVSEWVIDRPSRSRLFERLGIDYCCGGKQPLAEACRTKGLEPAEVMESLLQEGAADADADQRDWSRASLTELADHIVQTHHAYLKTELPRLEAIVDKVTNVHGERHPEMHQVRSVFQGLKDELESHLAKEEQVLFPMIRELERAGSRPSFHCGSIANPISVMEYEHDGAGNALASLRQLTRDYSTPADACNTWRAMADGLRQLEEDLHLHIHKENNILFPRALKLEQTLS